MTHPDTAPVLIGLGYVVLVGVIVGLAGGIFASASGSKVPKAVLVGSSGAAATMTLGLAVIALLVR